MFQFLLVVHLIIAVAMTAVILMQRSEGGGLTGGSPGGLMSARGAADFLTRTTTILAILFVGLSIALAALATMSRAPSTIDTTLQKKKDALDASASPPSVGASNAVTSPVVPLAETATPPIAGPDATPAPISAKADAKVKVEEKSPEKPKVAAPPPPPKPVVLPSTPSVSLPSAATPEPVKVPEGLIPPASQPQ